MLLKNFCTIFFVLGINCLFVNGQSANQKSTFAFVIDDTGSMGDDIAQVISKSKLIFDMVMTSASSQIQNFILVTFNDPDIRLALVTSNEHEFRSALGAINVSGGGDCPEMAMRGIEEALLNTLPQSYVYVFTDASAKDYAKYQKIKRMAQKQGTQIVFVLTGVCVPFYESDPAYKVYYDLATATSGQVFHVTKDEVGKILDFVGRSLGKRNSVVGSAEFPPGYGHKMPFETDKEMKDMKVSVTGRDPKLKITKPDGSEAKTTDIFRNDRTLVVGVPELDSGNHTAEVGSASKTRVVVTAATDVTFQHGFSVFKPTSINNTATRPILGKPSYLAIELSDKAKDVKLDEVMILDMDGNILSVRPLKEVAENFYIVEKDLPPNTMFRLKVKGHNKKTNEPITRLSATPIEPQTLATEELPVNKPPTVTLIGGTLKEVTYGESLQLQCKVNAYPMPKVTWIEEISGLTVSEMMTEQELPYDYISTLDLEQVKTNTSYQCRAANDFGEDKATVTVQAQDKFVALKISEDTSIDYDDEGTLFCKIDAIPPVQIIWYLNGSLLEEDDDLEISEDGSVLNIITMKPKFEGKFICEATNELKREYYYINTILTGTAPPKMDDSIKRVNVIRNETATIKCNVTEGLPQPGIRWSYKHRFAHEFVPLGGYSDIIEINKTDVRDAGIYKCEVINLFGRAEHEIELVVKYPPNIIKDKKAINTKVGKRIFLTCNVDGVPTPNVKWYFNGVVIKNSLRRRLYKDNTLSIKASLKDTGTYTCEAVNEVGSDTKTVTVTVYGPIRIIPPTQSILEAKVGGSIVIPCEAYGYPTPSIKWIHIAKESADYKVLRPSDASGSLRLSRLQLEQSGYYVCIAQNRGGSSNITYSLEIRAPPHIVKPSLPKTITAVVNDLSLNLPCEAKGNPKPMITWMKDGLNIPSGTDWHDINKDGTLVIKNVDDNSQGRYLCIAENSIGTDTFYFNINVQPYPEANEKFSVVEFDIGTSAKVECDIPNKRGDRLTWYKDTKIVATGELYLKNIEKEHGGLYTCRVSSFSGATSATKLVNVLSYLDFVGNSSSVIEFVPGAMANFSCLATGEPSPTVTWFHDDVRLEVTDMILLFPITSSDLGRYSCSVSNGYETLKRDFEIVIAECSLNNEISVDRPIVADIDVRDLTSADGKSLNVPRGKEISLYCKAGFEMFPVIDLSAICVGGSTFKIGDTKINLSDIKCKKGLIPVTKGTGRRCAKSASETIKVGFETNGTFDEIYEICYDKINNVPIYSTHNMNGSLAGAKLKDDVKWFENELVRYNYDDLYDCSNQIYHINLIRPLARGFDCCFAKRQLVNERDVSPGVPQVATYINLNVVPHWSTCGSKNWEDVEMRIRSLVKKVSRNLIVRTGASGILQFPTKTSRMQNIYVHDRDSKRQPVPKFLWKVVQDEFSRSSIAIIQVNVPDLKLSEAFGYLVCRDICSSILWMKNTQWRNVNYGFTFCCSIKEFESAFDLEGQFSVGFEGIFSDTLLIPEHSLT